MGYLPNEVLAYRPPGINHTPAPGTGRHALQRWRYRDVSHYQRVEKDAGHAYENAPSCSCNHCAAGHPGRRGESLVHHRRNAQCNLQRDPTESCTARHQRIVDAGGEFRRPLVNSTGADNPDTNVGPPFGTTPELKGVYLESAKKRTEALAKVGSEFKTSCKVLGMPTNMVGPYAVEIMQTPTQINWAQEFLRETRRIYLDGRAHPNPEEAPPTFEGHSVARWEGNVLVVETTNIRQETTLGEYGHADDSLGHGPRMIIKERIFINDQGLLQVDGRVEDQDALVKPWQWAPLIFRRAPKGASSWSSSARTAITSRSIP